MKEYSKQAVTALPGYNSKSAPLRFKLRTTTGFVPIDNLEGYGYSPINSQVYFKGFSAEITSDHYFDLIGKPAVAGDTVLKILKLGGSVVNPCIYLNTQAYESAAGVPKVVEYDNPEIAYALHYLGCTKLPVQFVLIGGEVLHSRTPKFMQWLNTVIMSSEQRPVLNVFKRLVFR